MAHVINFAKYPINQRESEQYQHIVQDARERLKRDGIFRLPNFILDSGVAMMQQQVKEIVETKDCEKNQRGRRVNCYYSEPDPNLPEDHPINTFFDREFGSIRDDMIAEDCVVRQIYDNFDLLKFVADVMSVPHLFQSNDPYQALNINVMRDGDNLHWHFDNNACAVTLGIQRPDSGGEFEYVPFIGRENYENIKEAMRLADVYAERTNAQVDEMIADTACKNIPKRVNIEEGQLVFFCGGQSIHRVRPVIGEKLRLLAALQYNTLPDSCSSKETNKRIYGVDPADQLGPKPTVVHS